LVSLIAIASLTAAGRHPFKLKDYHSLVDVAAAKLQNVMAVMEATGQCWQHPLSEDGKSASAGVGFHQGSLRPHSSGNPVRLPTRANSSAGFATLAAIRRASSG
jgi:hypothetical protein